MKIPLRGGNEHDAFSAWKRLIRYSPGARKSAKRSYAKRLRKWLKMETRKDTE